MKETTKLTTKELLKEEHVIDLTLEPGNNLHFKPFVYLNKIFAFFTKYVTCPRFNVLADTQVSVTPEMPKDKE